MSFGCFSYLGKRRGGKKGIGGREMVPENGKVTDESGVCVTFWLRPGGWVWMSCMSQCSHPCSGNSLSLATTEYCSLFFYSACQNAMTTGWFYENRAWLSRDSVSESQTWMAAIGTQRSQKPQIVFSLDEQLKAT